MVSVYLHEHSAAALRNVLLFGLLCDEGALNGGRLKRVVQSKRVRALPGFVVLILRLFYSYSSGDATGRRKEKDSFPVSLPRPEFLFCSQA
jgi:hypothetical protein